MQVHPLSNPPCFNGHPWVTPQFFRSCVSKWTFPKYVPTEFLVRRRSLWNITWACRCRRLWHPFPPNFWEWTFRIPALTELFPSTCPNPPKDSFYNTDAWFPKRIAIPISMPSILLSGISAGRSLRTGTLCARKCRRQMGRRY